MELSELNPLPVYAGFGEYSLELRPFDLRAVTWSESFFPNGLDTMNAFLGDSENWPVFSETVVSVVYYLLADPDIIPSVCAFKNVIKKSDEGPSKVIAELYRALKTVLYNSFPQQQDPVQPAKQLATKQPKEDVEEIKTDWSSIYVNVSKGLGGLSLDEFYKLTMRQLQSIITQISYEKVEELRTLAKLHGAKLKNNFSHKKPVQKSKWSTEDDEVFKNIHDEFLKNPKGSLEEIGNGGN